ncbi:PEP-CTERM sorting domain-containing protein [Candidatus Hydrogenedentota bacterium]
MKHNNVVNTCLVSGVALAITFLFAGSSSALTLGDNITIYDEVSNDYLWHRSGEDEEVEPHMDHGQSWDLEGFFIDGTILNMVGGYDFENGYSDFVSGDIFIDVDGIPDYGPGNDHTGSGNDPVLNTFGYDYVLDMDFASGTFDIYSLSGDSVLTDTVYYYQNQESNPWQFDIEDNPDAEALGVSEFDYYTGLSDQQVGGFEGASHNVVSLDLSALLNASDLPTALGDEMYFHFTMECGNDNLMGRYDLPPVPEPASISILSIGLAYLTFRKRRSGIRA